jgi:transcriptional regulator with XRE-family HTH domain
VGKGQAGKSCFSNERHGNYREPLFYNKHCVRAEVIQQIASRSTINRAAQSLQLPSPQRIWPNSNAIAVAVQLRRARGISLEAVAEKTKISPYALRAIEAGHFHKLPGGVYSTNYIKQYAQAIDFDPDLLLSYYVAATKPLQSSDIQPQKTLLGSTIGMALKVLKIIAKPFPPRIRSTPT